MLFTAIGFQKPVLVSDDMNPAVFERFPVGVTFPGGDMAALGRALECFINEYDSLAPQWHTALAEASRCYAPSRVAAQIAAILAEKT